MLIDLPSFIFGFILALSIVIVVEYIYGKLFGNKKIRELNREVRRLQAVIKKKNELIEKSLKEMKKVEEKDEK